jgi:type IV pilus assembly protein PilQ
MNPIGMSVRCLAALAATGCFQIAAWAQQATPSPAAEAAANSIENLQVSQQAGNTIVKVSLKQALANPPASFSIATPPRLAFDLPSTSNGLGRSMLPFNEGEVRSANVVQVGNRTRLVLNLNNMTTYETHSEGNDLYITLARPASAGAPGAPLVAHFAESKPQAVQQSVRDIAFHRGKNGEAKITVDLSDPNIGIDIHQQGTNLVVDFLKATAAPSLLRRLDVTDFATPVTTINTVAQGANTRLIISPHGLWEHNAYQSDNQFVIEVKQIVEDPRKLVQGSNGGYQGEKLSLNFQNVEVRAVLQVIADFTNFNIITSDSVGGTLTLRLKDVPWDQALDIILQAKGLAMRKNGNVIWIAPRDELATKEKLELESKLQVGDLEPLQTESFQINYHKAKALYDFLKNKDQTVLSKRGTVIADERSNKLFVTDTASRLDALRKLIAEVDVPVRQVLIEARIVEASNSFARNLGFRLGYHNMAGGQQLNGTNANFNVGGSLADTGFHTGQTTTQPPFPDAMSSVNLPAASIGGAQAGALSLILFNKASTEFLNLELSALEADGTGKIVSSPRVMTANQTEALIEQGTEIPYQQATSSGATSVSFRKANLALKVTPQITPDGRVVMSLDVNKDSPNTNLNTGTASGGIAIDTKHVKTDVLVENGGTVVIGGIYTETTSDTTTKIPLLGDLPFIGFMFRNNGKVDNKTELLIFVTPKIVDSGISLK